MTDSISNARRKLLVRMESMLGNECYNASMQNYGPGGVREADGRSFRYPLTFRAKDGTKTKIREISIPASVPTDTLLSGYYAFGANQLDVMASLNRILDHLESHYGLVINPVAKE
jgi:hypothetical protein